jgi:hypothetical protein
LSATSTGCGEALEISEEHLDFTEGPNGQPQFGRDQSHLPANRSSSGLRRSQIVSSMDQAVALL